MRGNFKQKDGDEKMLNKNKKILLQTGANCTKLTEMYSYIKKKIIFLKIQCKMFCPKFR